MDRILDKKLILIVYNSEGSKWHLPRIIWDSKDDSLRQVHHVILNS